MNRPDPLLRRFAAETAAKPEALARLRSRLGAPDVADIRAMLQAMPEPAPYAAARVRARLRAPRRRNAWIYAGGGALLAAAAALLVVLATRAHPLTAQLASEAEWSALAPSREVALEYRGTGALSGTTQAPRLQWDQGTLSVEVEPDAGIDLRVQTREADVRVVGTGFDVTRDAMGTTVSVRHGAVAVLCASGENTLLSPGESRTCAPTEAGPLLGRAMALAPTDPAGALASADAALAASPSPAIATELVRVRVESLLRLGRAPEALSAVEAALAEPGPRRRELLHLAVKAGLQAGGCEAAAPHLGAVVADDATGPELVAWADCVADTDPAAARSALTSALKGAPPEEEEAILERLLRLGARGR